MNDAQDKTFEEKAIAYAESYLEALTKTIKQYYSAEANEIVDKGYLWIYLTLYKKLLGKDLSISVFVADQDFYVFFTKPTKQQIRGFINKCGDPEFGSEWTHHTPDAVKKAKVMELLELNTSITIGEEVSIPGARFIANDINEIRRQAEGHGINRGQMYGELAQQYLPQLREMVQTTSSKLSIRSRYEDLKYNEKKDKATKLSAQRVGHEFESLWRDLLNMYGWQARKITIKGEGNDFTAIFDGHHILGEVRWEKSPLNGEAIDAFSGKLAPRPQTIGLIISYAGFNEGAYSAARRLVASGRTIVFFNREQIEKIIVSLIDPGEIFSIELRNVYDYLFENIEKQPVKKIKKKKLIIT